MLKTEKRFLSIITVLVMIIYSCSSQEYTTAKLAIPFLLSLLINAHLIPDLLRSSINLFAPGSIILLSLIFSHYLL